jgi:hypothetical protein
MYFRSHYCWLTNSQKTLLLDLGRLCGFKCTSDLPQWLSKKEKQDLYDFLEERPAIQKISPYQFEIDSRLIDFSSIMTLPEERNFPIALASLLGKGVIALREVLPAFRAAKFL